MPVRVPVTDLVGHPGVTRPLVRSVSREEFDELTPASAGDVGVPENDAADLALAVGAVCGPIELDLHLDSVVEGILVRGTLGVALETPCARCLEPVVIEDKLEVTELFRDPRKLEEGEEVDPGYEIIEGGVAIELDTMVRDAIVMDMPVRVLCREACQGLCPICGVDRNELDCGHRPETEPDPRWAALGELDLPPGS